MTFETPEEQPAPVTGSAPQPPADPEVGELDENVLGTDDDEQAETGADSMADAARQAESEELPQPD